MASKLSIRGLFRPLATSSSTMRPIISMLRATASLSSSSAPSTMPSTRATLLPKTTTTTTTTTTLPSSSTRLSRPFTTTFSRYATKGKANTKAAAAKGLKPGGKTPNKFDQSAAARRARRAAAVAKLDPKTANIMKFIYAGSQVRAPLRMARNRHLRHWTIHRAWLLLRRKREEGRTRELMRLRASMEHACETLRTMAGPGTRPEGYLYRKAMEKTGLWSPQAIPIEYARPLVETPGQTPWNHEWKRPEWM